MGVELWWLFAVAVVYLFILFLVAYAADSGRLPTKLVSHPLIYSLSLGVYATSWTYYGSVGLADTSGYAFLTIYLGVTGAFLLGPYLLKPLLTLCREYQLTSIADLLAFRYGGRGTGFVVTVFMLFGILPYISLQIRAVTESVQVLSQQVPPDILALVFCVMITVFAILFGARHLSPREKHHGLVVAIAFESAIKLVALLVAGVFVLTMVFDSPAAMSDWITQNPESVPSLYEPTNSGLWSTLLLLAFCAAFLLPRQYHMTFVENENPQHLKTAYWLFPLYLLLLNLPIIPILFAGRFLELNIAPDFYVLGMTLSLGKEWLAVLVFVGGLSAASAMMIVTSLALSYMCLNHLLLPASLSGAQPTDFYRRLLWSKRIIIALIIAAGYGFYIVIELNEGLASLGLISFVAAAQLLPGVFGVLYWSRATQVGFLSGLMGGAIVWFALLILPLLMPESRLIETIPVKTDIWTLSTFCSLSINGLLFVIGSLLSKPTLDEVAAVQASTEEESFALSAPYTARSALPYLYSMQQVLGNKVAEQEMSRALEETGLDINEIRPSELRLLHERLERNMSGLIGPTLARSIVRHNRPDTSMDAANSADTHLLEMRLEASREQMRGMTKQLDDLRRYLRDVLHQLPLGACSISAEGNIYLWNSAMQSLTGISERSAQERKLSELPAPWNTLLGQFADSPENHRFRCPVQVANNHVSVNLHKADIGTPSNSDDALAGQVILMEDRTDFDTLEAELAHSERLASVGRLAAGVAHEIGNPLTGIASLAQNLAYEAADTAETETSLSDAESVGDQAGDILSQVNRINEIVRSLLTFSHAGDITGNPHEPVRIKQSVQEAIRLVKLALDSKQFKFVVSIPDSTTVLGDTNQLVQVFVNLINNACDASPANSEIKILGEQSNNQIVIAIEDSGTGIDKTVREQIFEPFFTTKSVGKGTGLGLSLVYSIVSNHGGRVRIDDIYTPGTRIIVTLPTTEA
jgi:Na+/proline symporter/nitrogen-specific signal transduction histidine kinase